MAISRSYDSPPSGIAFANGSRSTQWLTEDEGKCCENGCERGFECVYVLNMFLCQGLACLV